jgi:hypothetical protein
MFFSEIGDEIFFNYGDNWFSERKISAEANENASLLNAYLPGPVRDYGTSTSLFMVPSNSLANSNLTMYLNTVEMIDRKLFANVPIAAEQVIEITRALLLQGKGDFSNK